jgi:hypothetical protein
MAPVILTCFAGRKRYLEILFVYVQKLMNSGHIHEFHIWDYTREIEDNKFIRDFSLKDPRFRLMSVFSRETFREYYNFYTKQRYPDPMTVIIKCDDDIVFIDVEQFPEFIERRRCNPDFLLGSAMVMNNPLCNCMQLSIGMISNDYFNNDDLAKLCHSMETPALIHQYFLEMRHRLVPDSRSLTNILPIDVSNGDTRLNINFFAILGKDLDVFQAVTASSDEVSIAIKLPIILRRINYIDPSFIVVHSAFDLQRRAGFDDTDFISKYKYIALH